MGLSETIYASGKIVSLLLVPIFRELAAVLLAFAISKDCKARRNGSGSLWWLFTLIMPIFSGIVYFVYSRILVKRKPETVEEKKKVKSSRRLTVVAVLIYVLSLIIAVVAFVTNIASGIAMHSGDDSISIIDSLLEEEEYYDRNDVKYDSKEDVLLYDKNGNEYHYAESPNGFNYYTYFDENNTEYDIENCYISKDGYFYYDKDASLTVEQHFLTNDIYYDSDGNEYASIELYVYWDKNGNILTNFGKSDIYAFE